MGGWKTWVAAVLAAGWGVMGFVIGHHDADTMMGFVIAAAGFVGFGHKLDKIKG